MIAYSEVCAFTDTPSQGNKAGVVLDASGLSEQQMQALAQFVGVPETVFVISMQRGVVEVRYFTPTQEVAFCGHASVALGLMLVQQGYWHGGFLELNTLAGRIPLRLEEENGVLKRVWFRQSHYESRPMPLLGGGAQWPQKVAEALETDKSLLHGALPLACCSIGLWSLMVPLRDSLSIDQLRPNFERVRELSLELGVVGLYVYAPMGVNRFVARDFSPLVGITEDPVTGSAGGALIALLASRRLLPLRAEKACGLIYQGHAVGSPGEIEVEVEMQDDRVQAVEVGGQAVLEREGFWQP